MTLPPTAAPTPTSAALLEAENCASAVSQALLAGDPDGLEAASRGLHQAALALSAMLQSQRGKPPADSDFKKRLGQVLLNLGMQREALLRRSAMVERSLNSIIPATRASTYGSTYAGTTAGSARSYGHNAKQSGAFKLFSA